jgi:hypothetical protein
LIGVSFVNLVFFPKFLPPGFGGKWVIETREVANICGHAGTSNSGRTLINFAIAWKKDSWTGNAPGADDTQTRDLRRLTKKVNGCFAVESRVSIS